MRASTAIATHCAARVSTLAELQHLESMMRRFREAESTAAWRSIADWMASSGFNPEHGCVLVIPPAVREHFPPGAPDWTRVAAEACAVYMINPRALGLVL